MNRTLSRALAITAITASALFAAFQPALAQGNWSWTDISDKIAERQNRPVWASGYASPFWYLTDGQDLNAGGHVWKTEGSVISDLTNDVRNAGITRVDDIVSDGQTVLFLQNIAPRNNSVQVVAYNGSFTNLTSNVRQNLSSNEGVVSVSGSNGTWGIVTSFGRALLYTPSSNTLRTSQISNVNTSSAYIQNHASGNNGADLTLDLQPVQGNWLAFSKNGSTVQFQKLDSYGNFSSLSYPGNSDDRIMFMVSNGQNVLIGGYRNVGGVFMYTFNGTTFQPVSQNSMPSSWSNAVSAWDGTSWIVIQNKNLYRFDGSSFESLGQTTDLFLNVSGNGAGTFLLGGAVSDASSGNNPSYPLTLKLAKAQESSVVNNTNNNGNLSLGGGGTYTSANGPTITTTGGPSSFSITNGDTFGYHAYATDPNGVDHIDLYVNSALIKTCYATSCDYSAQYFTNGLSTRAIPFQARATDRLGYSTSGNTENLTVTQYGGTTNNTSNSQTQNGTSFWTWTDPNQSTIGQNQTLTYYVGAYDASGINNIQILVNGNVRNTCNLSNANGNQQCSTVIYAGDYGLNTNVAVNAKVVAGNGNVAWTTLQNIYVSNNGSNNTNNTGDVSIWTTLDPTGSTLNTNSSVTFHVNGSATRGMSEMDVYANGTNIRTCYFNQSSGTQTCDVTIYGGNYSNQSQISLNAKATDSYSQVAWSDTKVLNIQNNGSNNGNGTSNTWITSNPDVSVLQSNQTVTFTANATDPSGIRRIVLYVNGNQQNTCDTGNVTYGTATCSTTLYGSNYSNGSSVYVNAKVTNGNGIDTWTQSRSYSVSNSNSNNNNNNQNGTTWIWSTPDVTQIGTNEQAQFFVGANDPNGVRKIDVYVNGSVNHTCDLGYSSNGNVQCSAYIYGSNYSAGSNVYVNALVTDGSGNQMWSQSRSYSIVSGTSNNNNNNGNTNSNTNSWTWSDPSVTTISSGNDTRFNVGAYDPDGIRKIEIYVNGSILKTCDLGYSQNGNVTCQYYLSGSSYSASSTLYVNARITDGYGNLAWSNATTYSVTGSNNNNNNNNNNQNGNASSWVWSDPNVTTLTSDQTVVFNVGAWSPNGIRTIQMYVNDSAVSRVCDTGYTQYGNVTCDYHTYGGALQGSTLNIRARITDGNGNVSWSDTKSFTITNTTVNPAPIPTNLPGTISVTSNHDSGFSNNETISFAATAADNDGIQKIELLVNGVLVKTCTNSNSCGYTGGPYNDRTTVSYGARLVDNQGNALWTGYKTINKH